MKTRALLFGWLLLLLGTSCVREEAETSLQAPGSGDLITIRVSMPDEPGSKVSFTDEDGVLKTAWQETDCIRVISGENSALYTISNIITPHAAEFTGPAVEGDSFDILFPGTYESVELAETDVLLPAQTGNGSTEHLRMHALLQGVDQYEELVFKSDWAAAHGGSFKQGAALKLVASLPEGTTALKQVNIGMGGNTYSMPLNDVDVSTSSQVLTAYLMLPWADIFIPDGGIIPISVTDAAEDVYSTEIYVSGDKTVLQGKMNTIGTQGNVSLAIQDFAGGEGTQADPYLIANARQLKNMNAIYNSAPDDASFKNWFRLIADIDASSITNWQPLNYKGSDWLKEIDFDGDGHTISHLTSSGYKYASFAGVLFGDIHDVTFDDAEIINGGTWCGVVAGFLGSAANVSRPASCTNVTVTGSSVTGSSNAGGFAGHVQTKGAVTGCSVVNTTVSGPSYVGGFAAQADLTGVDKYEVPVIFTDCTVDGAMVTNTKTSAGSYFTGGFVGYTYSAVSFMSCQVKSTTVSATDAAVDNVGGFVGGSDYAGANFQDCSVDASCIINAAGRRVGGFVGYANVPDAYKNCSSEATVNCSNEFVGGFAGYASGASCYTSCIAKGNVSGTLHAGGFAGIAENASFLDCSYLQGSVAASSTGKSVQSAGFCGYASSGVTCKGCIVDGASVSSPGGRVGGFVGQLGYTYASPNNITLSQCRVLNTSVSGAINTGAFVGVQYDNITRCYVSGGSVTAGGDHCGGFSGFSQQGSLTNCYTTASVVGGSKAQVGGFVGILYDSYVFSCYAAGSISGSGTDVAAFVGQCALQGNPGQIVNCIAWNASLPFCGSNPAGASVSNGYAGTEGTVSSQAASQGWSSSVWDILGGALPLLHDTPRRITAVFVGDSITWQWARNNNTFAESNLKIPFNSAYMTKSGTNVIVKFHPGFFAGNSFVDKGISGQNTTQMLARFDKDVIALNPEAVVIMGGTNDLAQGVSEEGIRDNIASMALKAANAGIKVVLCSVTPNDDSYSRLSNPKTKGAHIVYLNQLIKALADANGYAYCNYWSALVTDPVNDLSMKMAYRLYDNLHPGPDGYDVMEGIIKPVLSQLLNGGVQAEGAALPDLGGNDVIEESID